MRLIVNALWGIGVYAAVIRKLRIPSLTPSQSFISVPFASRSNGLLYVGVRVPRS
jgi:hypothetical protein